MDGYISTKNPAYITRDSNFRDRFKTVKLDEQIKMYMKTTGKTIDDIIEMCRPKRK